MSATRIVVQLDDGPRSLCSVLERKGGKDLIIVTRSAELSSNLNNLNDTSRMAFREFRASVHPSLESPAINVIKTQAVRDDGSEGGSKEEFFQLTCAIKSKSGMAMIHSRVAPSLRRDHFRQTIDCAKILSLGKMNPTTHTLSHSLFVAHPDDQTYKAIPTPPPIVGHGMSHIVVGAYRLVMLWSLVPLPSVDFGQTYTHITLDPDTATSAEQKARRERRMLGMSAQQAVLMHDFATGANMRSVLKYLMSIFTDDPTATRGLAAALKRMSAGPGGHIDAY